MRKYSPRCYPAYTCLLILLPLTVHKAWLTYQAQCQDGTDPNHHHGCSRNTAFPVGNNGLSHFVGDSCGAGARLRWLIPPAYEKSSTFSFSPHTHMHYVLLRLFFVCLFVRRSGRLIKIMTVRTMLWPWRTRSRPRWN